MPKGPKALGTSEEKIFWRNENFLKTNKIKIKIKIIQCCVEILLRINKKIFTM